ncbi:ribosome maturation factor RimM [Celeribacter marinus]|nr:ribosome maturation factor RimM [Celeribacter marinus]SFK08043.1 16S rRNA processing protein RimM [Celeribacter marinus]
MTDSMIIVGAIAGSFGVHGDVRIKSFCAVPEDIATYGTLMSDDGKRSFEIDITRSIKNGFSARIDGVITKEDADALKGVTLHVSRDALPSLPDDEFYHADLIGLEVCDTGGTVLGRVADVLNHGAGDLLEVNGPTLKASVLLPFTRAHVPTVDLSARRIIADPPEGLFE